MNNLLVSVIIPAYNCERYIRQAAQSAMSQTMNNLEILILDDCSTDSTREAMAELAHMDSRIQTFFNESNAGVAETRNRGIELARGEYIAFLDGDDVWLPNKLERQLEVMEQRRLELCYTAYAFIDAAGESTGNVYHIPEDMIFSRMLRENVIGCSSAVFRSAAAQGVRMRGEYAHEDYVFWLELLQKECRAGGIDEALMHYRVLKQSRSADKKIAAVNRWRIYRRFLEMPVIKSCLYLMLYMVAGLIKHLRIS